MANTHQNTTVVHVRLPNKLFKALKAMAAEEQRPLANLVNLLLTKAVENGK